MIDATETPRGTRRSPAFSAIPGRNAAVQELEGLSHGRCNGTEQDAPRPLPRPRWARRRGTTLPDGLFVVDNQLVLRKTDGEEARAEAAAAKRKLIERARELSDSSDWKGTGNELHRLLEEWKAAGWAGKPMDDQLWRKFKEARQRFFDRRTAYFKQRDRNREDSRFAKRRLVAEAKSVSKSTDFGAAFKRLRELSARWKATGSAGRDEEALWREFKGAGDHLRKRADDARSLAAALKQWILEEASSIAGHGDLRTAGTQMRDLMIRWKAAGSAGKVMDDSLWMRFQGYRRQLDARYAQSKAERSQRTRDFLLRLEQASQRKREALARTESRIYDIRGRPPIRPGPRQYEFIAQREAKLGQLATKRDSIARDLADIEAKIAKVRREL